MILRNHFDNHLYCCFCNGGVAEWMKATVLKTVEGKPSVGSNPTASARNSLRRETGGTEVVADFRVAENRESYRLRQETIRLAIGAFFIGA